MSNNECDLCLAALLVIDSLGMCATTEAIRTAQKALHDHFDEAHEFGWLYHETT